ncbi:uncharacterized protein LOC122279172 isoform X2 [Carya illinoinensis]|uniref:uncharacterized protein LOC122279172 isoform X2 n=1 Tax=Carya illinoinensis TaxID=32201 RepID=UPI001C71C949|nr:uncharacterized protein LOC122279172 isoform X2 [Carya illinoinensis]
MSKLRLFATALGSRLTVRTVRENHGIPLLLREFPRWFSTEAEQPPQDSAVDPFLQTPGTGLVYGRLIGVTRHTLKTDIVNLLEGCKLTLDDVKVDYNRSFSPVGMMVQFPSRNAFDQAIRVIGKKGRLYKLERADRSQWDLLIPFNGKALQWCIGREWNWKKGKQQLEGAKKEEVAVNSLSFVAYGVVFH